VVDLEEVVDDQEAEDTEVDEDDLVEVEGTEEDDHLVEDTRVADDPEDTKGLTLTVDQVLVVGTKVVHHEREVIREEVAQAVEVIKVETLVEDTREEPLEREVIKVEDDLEEVLEDTKVVVDHLVEVIKVDDLADEQVETMGQLQDATQAVDLLQEVRAVETSVSLVRNSHSEHSIKSPCLRQGDFIFNRKIYPLFIFTLRSIQAPPLLTK
jgi:hypothetical protein